MSDARLTGIALVLAAPLVVVTGIASARGGFASGSFWRSPQDVKLDHIAGRTGEWLALHVVWVVLLLVTMGGMSGLGAVLAGAGEPVLAAIGAGLFLGSITCWLVGVALQGAPGAIAARARRERGETPGWLEPLFAVVGWMEVAYVAGTGAGYVVLGTAIVESGVPGSWAGWTSIALGSLALAGTIVARHWVTFPELPLIVPIVLGVALLST